MVFPMWIVGGVQVEPQAVPHNIDIHARLRDALTAETVENVVIDGDSVRFRMIMKIRGQVARPGGQRWLFSIFDCGRFVIRYGANISIDYRISTRWAFCSFLGIAALGLGFILFGGGAAQKFGIFWILFWSLGFVGSYQGRAKDLRRWLQLIATAEAMPPPKPLLHDDP